MSAVLSHGAYGVSKLYICHLGCVLYIQRMYIIHSVLAVSFSVFIWKLLTCMYRFIILLYSALYTGLWCDVVGCKHTCRVQFTLTQGWFISTVLVYP